MRQNDDSDQFSFVDAGRVLRRKKVISVADPPEGIYRGIWQTSIDFDIDQRGKSVLEQIVAASLRSSPHYINFGEIRSAKMAAWCFVALTQGKGLLATTHTHNGLDIPERYAKLGVDPADAFNPKYHSAIMSQRLVPQLCHGCRVLLTAVADRSRMHAALLHQWRSAIGDSAEVLFVRGPGCPACKPPGKVTQPGVTGRRLYAEVVPRSTELFGRLRANPFDARRYWLNDLGHKSMRLYALPDLLTGNISAADFAEFFSSPAFLREDWLHSPLAVSEIGTPPGSFLSLGH